MKRLKHYVVMDVPDPSDQVHPHLDSVKKSFTLLVFDLLNKWFVNTLNTSPYSLFYGLFIHLVISLFILEKTCITIPS